MNSTFSFFTSSFSSCLPKKSWWNITFFYQSFFQLPDTLLHEPGSALHMTREEYITFGCQRIATFEGDFREGWLNLLSLFVLEWIVLYNCFSLIVIFFYIKTNIKSILKCKLSHPFSEFLTTLKFLTNPSRENFSPSHAWLKYGWKTIWVRPLWWSCQAPLDILLLFENFVSPWRDSCF